ncbi:HSF-type DNA-binding-domain-containing protein [Piptocephalis cylindrospora]|uniref:HSF-type DNA-binding-domain-containing protein n=1 Tax=Piptocephalis cylindrospora TaxID=1907219 RepID=A0A4P9Y098_9FUNG|nr:HSF-type DNA-binding-domain-containing protein [Piptocephalis cylindrospora]|eukprot:RKP12127.1 HSF-type DNA-binding-domain-containing protein [Piptocephalis cylindrospora]
MAHNSRKGSKVVGWTAQGDSFVVYEPNTFERTLLPRYFRHANLASFVRQLNKYDFHKVRVSSSSSTAAAPAPTSITSTGWEYWHSQFIRHRPELLVHIRVGPSRVLELTGSVNH